MLELVVADGLFRGFGSRICFLLRCFRSFGLRFDALAFPAACHAYSVTQIVQIAGESEEKGGEKSIKRRRRGAGEERGERGASRCGWWFRRRARDARQRCRRMRNQRIDSPRSFPAARILQIPRRKRH